MRDARKLWTIIVVAMSLGVVAGGLVFGLAFRAARRPPASTPPAPAARFVRHSGAPASGEAIAEATLDRELPPAPPDSVAFDVRDPLRNGVTTEQKSRWLYVPAGKRIALTRSPADGKLSMTVPAGTMLWKEFYLRTDRGPQLIERRILKKVETLPQKNGGLLNGGWRFWAAHHLPESADGLRGYESMVSDTLDEAGQSRWLFKPDEWLPTQAKSAMTQAVFKDARGQSVPYVFPGKVNCEYCHAGAEATVHPDPPEVLLGYGLHPENMTVESFRAVVARGWIEAPAGLVEELTRAPAGAVDAQTAAVLSVWRNNCLSCHTGSRRAAGRETAFVLDPTVQYGREELAGRLAARAKFMGPLGRPMVSFGHPDQSEIVLRLKGEEGRRRMPPVEGGVPEPDREQIAQVSEWVAGWK